MYDVSSSHDRRAQSVSLVGLIIQLTGVGVVLGVGLWSGAESILAGARHFGGGVLIWLVLLMAFTQRRKAGLKDVEIEAIRRSREADATTAIFELEEASIERRRLAWIQRWVFPLTAVLLAAYHIVGSLFIGWSWRLGARMDDPVWTRLDRPGPIMAVLAGIGFVCFLYSRYTAGMSQQPQWRLLRAGASYLAGNALACLALVMAAGLQAYDKTLGEPIVAHGIRVLMLLLGVEFVVALLLNYYRPRLPGAEARPSFDSRLLEMISQPGGVAKNIADAINYQFGFEVTKTWFAQLLKRAFLPLVVVTALVLLLLSSIVIVDADEEAYVEHFGRLTRAADSSSGALEPGLHVKWPWPIDRVRRARVRQLRQIVVGETPTKAEVDEEGRLKPILWTEQHEFTSEMMMVVARETGPEVGGGQGKVGDKSVAVALMMLSVPIEYRIKNLHDYLYRYADPEAVVEAIAFRALSDYAAGIDIGTLMGRGRSDFNDEFRDKLQDEIDALGLGIEITFLALQDAHPPAKDDVAKTFQKVVTSDIRKNAQIARARGRVRTILTEVAGSVERARALDQVVREMDALAADPDATEAEKAEIKARMDDLLFGNPAKSILPMSGEAAERIAEAQARRTRDVSEARSKARVFEAELAAYQAAPLLYRMRKYLNMLERSVQDIRKWVVTGDTKNLVVILESEKKSAIDIGEEPKQ